ncbi:MAG: AAA family ATPase [Chloroflexi bacterium]|nr:AAA family ATPase [Chloroflexota bacterium]
MENKLPPAVAAFLAPSFYAHKPQQVQFIQTHISYIFIADELVYKVKKAVNYGWVDYQSLKKRKLACQLENDLNARFSPEVYLGVVPVSLENGQYVLGSHQNITEYAVKMTHLPQENMLDYMLQNGQISIQNIQELASYIASLHKKALPAADKVYGSYQQIFQNAAENFPDILKNTCGLLSRKDLAKVQTISLAMIRANKVLLDKRHQNEHIKDLHGDLHTAHICFTSYGPRIYDCIDFNTAFRCIDNAAEVAFLAMDLDSKGRADLSAAFVQAYIEACGDYQAQELITMYKTYYALVRCKVASFELKDPDINYRQKRAARAKVRNYFNLAYTYCLLLKTVLAITVGLSGCGKSTLAQMLCHQMPLVYLNSDIIRKEMLGLNSQDTCRTKFNSGIYTLENTQKTYCRLYKIAQAYLQTGQSVIIDASFGKHQQRNSAKQLAERNGVDFKIIEFDVPDATCLLNLSRRKDGKSISDARADTFFEQKKSFETLKDAPKHAIISKIRSYRTIKEIIDYLVS